MVVVVVGGWVGGGWVGGGWVGGGWVGCVGGPSPYLTNVQSGGGYPLRQRQIPS